MSVYGYQHKPTQAPLVALWLDGKEATNSFQTTPVSITVENMNFKKPVWVDMMTGSIYEIPKSQWSKSGNSCTFNIPLYDSPVLITEKSFLTK
jgi:cytochrome b involved in lipid metabolism